MDLKDLLLKGLATTQETPSHGGLRVADFPNQYGLRYGENAIPKSTGWIGLHNGKNGVMSEYSISDERGIEYPSFVPGTTPHNLDLLKREIITPEQESLARRFSEQRIREGKSPFHDPFLDALGRLPK